MFVSVSMTKRTKVGLNHSPCEEQKEEPTVFGNCVVTHEFSQFMTTALLLINVTTPEACSLL